MPRTTRTHRFLSPILKRNGDTSIAGRFLVLCPIRHVFCGVFLDVVGIAGAFRPRWLMFPLFSIPPVLQLEDLKGVGGKYYGEEIFQLPEERLVEQLCSDIEIGALPFFRSITAFDNLYKYAMDGDLQIWQHEALHFRLELAMGNFDAAEMLMRWHRKKWFSQPHSDEYNRERQLCVLLDTKDHAGIGALLREVEVVIATNYKVQHLWEPSPFPFEPDYDEWLRRSGSKPG